MPFNTLKTNFSFGNAPPLQKPMANAISISKDGSPLQYPTVFNTFSPSQTRGLFNKIIPKLTITADEIRLSKAAEREALNTAKLGPWSSKNIFLPNPSH
jgi:hypothetical protein